MGKIDDDNKKLEQLIIELDKDGKLPYLTLEVGTILYRVQTQGHSTANHYHAPVQPEKLGRYNDPCFEMVVWYGAQLPTGALAEILGRERVKKASAGRLYLNWDIDLKHFSMCEVEIQEQLKVLDIKRVLTRLGIPLDEIAGPSYDLTQQIVRVVSRLPGQTLSGVAYESRHNPDGSYCYALWKKADEKAPLSEGSIESFSDYTYSGDIAKTYEGSKMMVEEMLTDILGYNIT